MQYRNPYSIILLSFLLFLIIGSILLYLPISQKKPTDFIDCLFIATSAFTVTGLASIDITQNFNYVGLTVIMFLIQMGGLGIVTLAIVVFMMLGKKVGFKNRFLVAEALNQGSFGGIIKLVKYLFFISISIELLGAIILACEWVPDLGVKKGLYNSIFTAVSAFNNAGFALHSDNLIPYQTNPIVNFVITSLIILGGLGFTVMIDVTKKKSFKSWKVQTKVMVITTFIVNVLATVILFLLEHNNLKTIGQFSTFDQWQMSYFQAITTRTAGFNTIDIGSLNNDSILVMMLLMFIGGGSTSTAGGIKLTTMVIILFGTLSFIRQQDEIVIFKRAIDIKYLIRSFAIVVLSFIMIFIITFFLVLVEPDKQFIALFFEVVSAFGTVGLTLGITTKLSVIGKLLVILMMMIGKIGVLTIVLTFSRPRKQLYYHPKEDILVG
ncbi:Ktr system potassium transporter B [Macrococcus sp. DPC7161]|nr:Ktr system potassium transporter B [Macrococcus sp. DPC7161]